MQWQAIRESYPHQWLLLEAIKAHSEGDRRILDQLAVLGVGDSVTALQSYAQIHRESPGRELLPWNGRTSVEWEGGTLKVLSPKGLIELKSLRNNNQDQDDIQYFMGLLDED